MIWKIEVAPRSHASSIDSTILKKNVLSLGVEAIDRVQVARLYFLEGNVKETELKQICEALLCDPVTERYSINSPVFEEEKGGQHVLVAYNPGVMDPVEASLRKALSDMSIQGITHARTGWKYILYGDLSRDAIVLIAKKLLFNPLIQHIVEEDERVGIEVAEYKFNIVEVNLSSMNVHELNSFSRTQQLYLSEEEMVAVQRYFQKAGRNPTDCELETTAQTWSEHCSHKTFKGIIRYNGKRIDNLLRSTIMRVTDELAPDWCVSVFEDNAGIIKWDDDYNLCFKVETHNHPSALEPYGGAGTGIGGVIRDALGTGLGAKPICNTDVFCFGPLDHPHSELPPGVLHPKRIMVGVVAGVRDYGNRMGIPTLNGAIYFDDRYLGNPVVYCGTVGIIPTTRCTKKVVPGDKIVLIGGRTGKDGIHGVTFSSSQLTHESEEISAQAVQIGNPIVEKKLLDTILQARDREFYHAITDCGGGGLSSAVGEMGRETGASVELDRVPLKYEGLSYTDIWISESQERMVLAVPSIHVDDLIALFHSEDVEATVIGEFTHDSNLTLKYKGERVCDIPMSFLHSVPRIEKEAVWKPKMEVEPALAPPLDLASDLLRILSSPNVCSKEWVIRQYDHEVQGGSVVKPLTGTRNEGPSDAAVIRPLLQSPKGVVVANGMNPRYGDIDPYWMAASAVDEAMRNSVAVGGNPGRTALLDNFSWGSSTDPESLGALVRAAQGCHDTALAYRVPFISGKDSLNNQYEWQNRILSIPHTLLISAISVIERTELAITLDLKTPGDLIYLIGLTAAELGASHYYGLKGILGNSVPKLNVELGSTILTCVSQAIEKQYLRACHDLSEGGLGVALAEMAFSGDCGVHMDLKHVVTAEDIERADTLLFSESNSRFLVEVPRGRRREFELLMREVPFACIGEVKEHPILTIHGLSGETLVEIETELLRNAWLQPLSEKLE